MLMMISLTGLMLSFNMKFMMKESSMDQLALTIAIFGQAIKIVFLRLCNFISLKRLVVYYHLLLYRQRIGKDSFARKMVTFSIRKSGIQHMHFQILLSMKLMLVIYTTAYPHAQTTKSRLKKLKITRINTKKQLSVISLRNKLMCILRCTAMISSACLQIWEVLLVSGWDCLQFVSQINYSLSGMPLQNGVKEWNN